MAPRRPRTAKRAVDDDLALVGVLRLDPPLHVGDKKLLYKCTKCSKPFDRLLTAQNHPRDCPGGQAAGRAQTRDEGTGDDTGNQPVAGNQPPGVVDLGRVDEVLFEVRLSLITSSALEC